MLIHRKTVISLLFGFVMFPVWVSASRYQAETASAPSALSGDHRFVLRFGEQDRHYNVHVPPGYNAMTPVPVVVMLHGGGATAQAAATETGWGAKADVAGFLAVFPDAMPPDSAKASHFLRNPPLWNDGSGRLYSGQNAPDDVGFINAVLDDLFARFSVDPQRIFVTGFSNGASMAFHVGAVLSKRIAAIAPVAGSSWLKSLNLERALPVLYITGTADPLNPLEGGVPRLATGRSDPVRGKPKPPVRDSILQWALALGCPATPRDIWESNGVRTEIYGPGRDGVEVVYTMIEGMGHTWAGGTGLLPEFMVGKPSDKIQATDAIWAFFQKHPMKRYG